MLKKALLLCLFFITAFCYTQEKKLTYKEYSYSKFFKLIEEEKDSVFVLENALIKPDYNEDKKFFKDYKALHKTAKYKEIDSVYKINKEIKLNNVQFKPYHINEINPQNRKFAALNNIHFLKQVKLKNVANLIFNDVIFNETVTILYTSELKQFSSMFSAIQLDDIINFNNCLFKDGISFSDNSRNETTNVQFGINNSIIKPQRTLAKKTDLWVNSSAFRFNDFSRFNFNNNQVEIIGASTFFLNKINSLVLSNNSFTNPVIIF
jgi:hypothetical protein